jgi:hypothetical protein
MIDMQFDRDFSARAKPAPDQQRLIEEGRYHGHWPHPHLHWWDHGALVVDGAGVGLVDAEGLRHEIAVPGAAKLCRIEEFSTGVDFRADDLFVTDAAHNVLVDLPPASEGWDEADLKEFAGLAGLSYETYWVNAGDGSVLFPRSHRTRNLRGAIYVHSRHSHNLGPHVRSLLPWAHHGGESADGGHGGESADSPPHATPPTSDNR